MSGLLAEPRQAAHRMQEHRCHSRAATDLQITIDVDSVQQHITQQRRRAVKARNDQHAAHAGIDR